MNPTRTFSILLAALALVSAAPLLVVAAQVAKPHENSKPAPLVQPTHHQLGLEF
jgi:hypothetical protein